MNKLTLKAIKKDYEDIVSMVMECATLDDLYRLARRCGLDIEINGDSIYQIMQDPITTEDIEFVRVDEYENLDYIYFWDWNSGNPSIYFDVWSEEFLEDVITDAQISNIDILFEEYEEWAKLNREEDAV